jgi:CDP-diacylglycerol--serine O-phosphatidyltransferase
MKLRRTRLVLPSAFTAGNLFFGLFAMVSAFRGEVRSACWLIILGGVLDFIDGKVAKISKTHTQFGAELDSLADIVSFGVAPAVVMYFYLLSGRGEWSWLLVFLFVLAGALRLARYNVEKPGPEKKSFTGLPIPVAGGILVSFIPFSQTGIPDRILGSIGEGKFITVLITIFSILMVSQVRYANFPRIHVRSLRGIAVLVVITTLILVMIVFPDYAIFPLGTVYISWGLLKEVLGGFFEDDTKESQRSGERPLVLEAKRNDRTIHPR